MGRTLLCSFLPLYLNPTVKHAHQHVVAGITISFLDRRKSVQGGHCCNDHPIIATMVISLIRRGRRRRRRMISL